MIVKSQLEQDLKRLRRLYQDCQGGADATIPLFYSKLAVLELCGWVEESFDMIAERAVRSYVKQQRFQEKVTQTIKKNYGFSYSNNFIPMLSALIGIPGCERLHVYLELDGSASVLDGELGALLSQRRKAAHVNLARTSIAFDSPSVTLHRLGRVYPVLRKMYTWCRSARA